MTPIVLATLLVAAAPNATSIVLESPGTIRLDRHHYAIGSGTIEVGPEASGGGTFLAKQSLAMQDCVRPAGESQQLTSNAWRWTQGLRVVFLDPAAGGMQLEYANGAWTVALRSATGDVECAGKVVDPGVIFSSDFE